MTLGGVASYDAVFGYDDAFVFGLWRLNVDFFINCGERSAFRRMKARSVTYLWRLEAAFPAEA